MAQGSEREAERRHMEKKFAVRRRIERLLGALHDVVVRLLPVAAEDRRTEA
jgi:hypothetical protein